MNKFKLYFHLLHNMGLRYFIFRTFFEIKKRTGLLRKVYPTSSNFKKFISIDSFRKDFLFLNVENNKYQKQDFPKEYLNELEHNSTKILNGEILFFNNEWKKIGLDYNWLENPDNRYEYNKNTHWSDINDFSSESGDIKFVWEKSRFTYLLTIIRYDAYFKKDHSKFVFEEIENWIDSNPINLGPNWKCSQEISLRIFNWCFVLDFYRNSPELTDELWNKIENVIYWSLHHVYNNINFSRIAVRNNHAITETLFLACSELLFPFIPETKIWSKKGRGWLEKEICYQIYEDGTYLQFSMNYQRVVIQLLSLGITITENHSKKLSNKVYERAYKSLNFLYQCLQEENGKLPNYGSNDGALFFPLSNLDYRDYRPQLNNLHLILTGKPLFVDNNLAQEDSLWITSNNKIFSFEPLKKQMGIISFPIGGFYLIRDQNDFTMIRCGNHKDRPAQADNLHVDVWVKGENILRDSGTYKYNTDKKYSDYFMGTISHNTVTVDDKSQMYKGNRFIWFYWTQANYASLRETETHYIFDGEISCFRYINKNIRHKRTLMKLKSQNNWSVKDQINAKNTRQNWHFGSKIVPLLETEQKTIKKEFDSYDSPYYGNKTNQKSIYFEFENEISTKISIP